MTNPIDRTASAADIPSPLIEHIFRREWLVWGAGAILAYLITNFLIAGWAHIFVPDLSYPYFNAADGLYNGMLIKRAMEGWVFSNPRQAYPFDSSLLDYPNSDSLNFLLFKFYGFLTGSFYGTMDLFIVLTFPLAYISAYLVSRCFGIRRSLALMTGLLFAFTPFGFMRFGHILLLSYFTVPLFFYFGYRCVRRPVAATIGESRFRRLLPCGAGVLLASFGFYNAAFGIILLGVSAVFSILSTRRLSGAVFAILMILSTGLGVGLNITPNIIHRLENGTNREVGHRIIQESQTYGLMLIQLLYPRSGHRLGVLAHATERYERDNPAINENQTAALGAIGSLGFVMLSATIILALSGRRLDSRLAFLALAVLILFLFGTIGGLGMIFADRVVTLVRCWNRISLFIAFGALVGFALLLQRGLNAVLKPASERWRRRGVWITAAMLSVLGIADQTPPRCVSCNHRARASFESERAFIQAIERVMPPGSPIYQLPHMGFPEEPPAYKLQDYGLASGFVNSSTLRWSYGGMKGRPGDFFYRSLAEQPPERQLAVLRRLGFAGLYIDRRGFPDNGDALIAQLSKQLGKGPILTRADGAIVFFRLDFPAVQLSGSSPQQIMEVADYRVDAEGRYKAGVSDPLSFARTTWPDYIASIQGLSGPESWGRWSDADVSPTVRVTFVNPLPAAFTLVVTASGFGPNATAPTVIRIGSQSYPVTFGSQATEYRIPVRLGAEKSKAIEIVPPQPISPKQLGVSSDTRRLGISLWQLKIDPQS